MRSSSSFLATLVVLLSLGAAAQTFNVASPGLDRSLTLPPTSAAFADDATSSVLNPAGLTYAKQLQFFWLHERSFLKDRVNDGIFVGDTFFNHFGVGYEHEWIRTATEDAFRKFSWAFSLGNPWASFGASFHWYRSELDPDLNALRTVDLGFLVRPLRQMSLGFVVKNVDRPTSGAVSLARRYDLAVGVRPLGERISLGADLLFDEGGLSTGQLGYTLNAEVLRGLIVNAGLSHRLSGGGVAFQLGLTVNLPTAGLAYAIGSSTGAVNHVTLLRLSNERYRSVPVRDQRIAYLDLSDELSARTSAAMTILGIQSEDPFLTLMRKLNAASEDPRLAGLVVKIEGLPDVGTAKADELRKAFLRLRAKGKTVVAMLFGASDAEYLAASSANKIYAVPEAMLTLNGLAMNATFLGEGLEKLGVKIEVARVGAYKNAPDMFTRTSMSGEQREAMNAFLDATVRTYQSALGQGRGFTPDRLNEMYAEALIPPARAKHMGIIDEVVVPQELEEQVERLIPNARFVRGYDPFEVREGRWAAKKKIALIPVVGDILGGRSRSDPFGIAKIAGAETIVQALESARRDPTVSAIVLRIDSPGGGALASDLLYRAVVQARKDKPVIASMGDVAASGGYMAAMGADEILASPSTLTGSIGVFLIKPSAEGLASKLGIHREALVRGPHANLFDLVKPWSEEDRALAQKWVDASYDGFITEVAKNRKRDKAQIDGVARGRIWAGEDAKDRGLVDTFGGLWEAIEAAKSRAGIPAHEDVEWEIVSEPQGPLAQVVTGDGVVAKLTEGLAPTPPVMPEVFRRAALELGIHPEALADPELKALMPFNVQVR
jgi:protease IV